MAKKKNKEKDKTGKDKELCLEEMNVIMRIPENAAAITVEAMVIEEEKAVWVKKRMGLKDITKARQDFLANVEDGDDYDTKFVITEEGRKWLEEMERNGNLESSDEYGTQQLGLQHTQEDF